MQDENAEVGLSLKQRIALFAARKKEGARPPATGSPQRALLASRVGSVNSIASSLAASSSRVGGLRVASAHSAAAAAVVAPTVPPTAVSGASVAGAAALQAAPPQAPALTFEQLSVAPPIGVSVAAATPSVCAPSADVALPIDTPGSGSAASAPSDAGTASVPPPTGCAASIEGSAAAAASARPSDVAAISALPADRTSASAQPVAIAITVATAPGVDVGVRIAFSEGACRIAAIDPIGAAALAGCMVGDVVAAIAVDGGSACSVAGLDEASLRARITAARSSGCAMTLTCKRTQE